MRQRHLITKLKHAITLLGIAAVAVVHGLDTTRTRLADLTTTRIAPRLRAAIHTAIQALPERLRRQPRRRIMAAGLATAAVLTAAPLAALNTTGHTSPTTPAATATAPAPTHTQPQAPAPAPAPAGLAPDQVDNAKAIAQVAADRGLPDHAVTVALATSLQETGLKNLTYGDRDSLGLFQQRPSQGWGTPQQILDPHYAADKFFDGLVQVPNWDTKPVTVAAQEVQRSAFPDAYAKWEPLATQLTNAITPTIHAHH